jgi:AAA15 family ATPase/GTPase
MNECYMKSLSILGYRGFLSTRTIEFAVPQGVRGSGLTILVGPNNSGKSTIIEALSAFAYHSTRSFPEGKRNKKAGDRVSLNLINTKGESKELKTVETGGSETKWVNEQCEPKRGKISVLPSRRLFEAFFAKNEWNRETYSTHAFPESRGSAVQFSPRLFTIQKNREEFNKVLRRVLNPLPEWYIEQNDSNQYYLKFKTGDCFHNSEGMGEGFVSLFFLVDALYDSKPGDIIVIDEPELSLHPQLQKSLRVCNKII